MERGVATVAPRTGGVRRHKALAPWRFRRGFVRCQVKAATSDDGCCGSEALGSDGEAWVDGGFEGSGSEGGGVGCELETSGSSGCARDSELEDLRRSGRVGEEYVLERSGSNWSLRDCSSEGLGRNGGVEDLKSKGDGQNCELQGEKSAIASSVVNWGGSKSSGSCCSTAGDYRSEGQKRLDRLGDSVLHGLEGLHSSAAAGDHRVDGILYSKEAAKGCNLEGLKGDATGKERNAAAKVCDLESSESNGIARETNGAAKFCNLEGFKGNGAAKECNGETKVCNLDDLESNVLTGEINGAAKVCSLAGSQSTSRAVNCRKGQKALAPWRFQIGYKRPFSKGFSRNNGSLGSQESNVQDGLSQHTPAMGSTISTLHSSVRVSATCDFSSFKDETEASATLKKRKIDKDDDHQVMPNNGAVITRESVMGYLQEFQIIYRRLMEEEESKWRETGRGPRLDIAAFKIFRGNPYIQYNDRRYVGSVPGVQIGDVFHLRVELCVVGLHRPQRMGVDYIKEDGTCIAVSIVSYAHPSDVKNKLDVFVYTGSLATTSDQKIDGTNLALKRSMDTNTPVRVIHGFVTYRGENYRPKNLATYIYGGLYRVEKYWSDKVCEERCVYMFSLRRMAEQPHIDIQEIVKSRKPDPHYVIFMEDISLGLERIPISIVNSISNEYPMSFHYISRLQYPSKYQPAPPAGCDCVDGCSDSEKCACSMKNGGESLFNDKGAIIEAKPLVYECGPSCKCPPMCHNRVSQHGIKFHLQVFKTKSIGWGVRSLDFIPSGSFVCEYIGELLEDEEAQKRTNDEYLFAIGNNYFDESLWEGLSRSIPSLQKGPIEDEEVGFDVDALNMGNIARFINHNCTPNLYAQNILFDHDNKSMPHIMFFACEDIPPFQELSYHYNYTIDQVHDSNGNIKKKKCLCGSIECTGWLY